MFQIPTIPREAAMALSMALRLIALGSRATEVDCEAFDRELEHLRESLLPLAVADDIANFVAENV